MRLRSKLTPTQFWLLSFLGVNLILILLQIYKQSVFVKTAYAQQRLERERDTLRQQRARQIAALHTQQAYQQVQQ
ncbi:MAG TPA: hypothetical protein VJJ83_05550, partial [Candidatus Babeliales bacterium]|nr:hypothetical protein [Candidatus Babeliales bacterium]